MVDVPVPDPRTAARGRSGRRIRRAPPLIRAGLVALVAALCAAACGGSPDTEPRPPRDDLLFGEFLDTTPQACGLRERPPSTAALDRARGVERQVAEGGRLVKEIRSLAAARLPTPTFVSENEMRARFDRLAHEEFGERDLAAAERALVLLGAAPADFSILETLDALAQTTAGLYDPDQKQILVLGERSERLPAGVLETVAHELEHALVDQTLTLPDGDKADRWGDTHLAASALAEGDAILVAQLRFLAARTNAGFVDAVLRAPAGDLFAVHGLPHVIERSIAFPYLEGIGFVCTLYARGGWEAVDAAYRRPPRSSAEILFPKRYLSGERPKRPDALGRLPAPWTRARFAGVFGAADLQWLFSAPGDDERRRLERPLARAGGWAGGRIEIWRNGERSALATALVQRRGSPSLCASLAEWYGRAFPRAARSGTTSDVTFREMKQTAVVRCRGDQVRLGIAPSAPLARILVE